ncbi:hypothetical protein TcCL_NonESM08856 [Trypanosoma cruzi]|nr:hypothetical protein TcCL_NonESM08856 [Trypanosoma cruzi]
MLRRNVRQLLSVKQLRVLHGPHNRRHAPAAQHPQRHNVVPPLLHNHERSAKRVLAHVLHALQPHADQAGRHAMQLVVLLVVGADPSSLSIHGLGAARDCREVPHVWKIQCAETAATLTTSRISAPSTLPHTQGRCHGEKKPAAQQMHEGTKKHRHPRRTAR